MGPTVRSATESLARLRETLGRSSIGLKARPIKSGRGYPRSRAQGAQRFVAEQLISGLLTAMLFGATTVPAFAALFGPDNYEECILEKMKGQGQGQPSAVFRKLFRLAQEACEIKFPFEKQLVGYSGGLRVEWSKSRGELILEIKENSTKYRITRYRADFARHTCDSKGTESYVIRKGKKIPFFNPFLIGLRTRIENPKRIEFIFPPGSVVATRKTDDARKYKYMCEDNKEIFGVRIKP